MSRASLPIDGSTPPFYSPRQLGEVGEVAERGDGFGLGDERADASG